jgi:hypothetical protein
MRFHAHADLRFVKFHDVVVNGKWYIVPTGMSEEHVRRNGTDKEDLFQGNTPEYDRINETNKPH